MPTRGVSLLTAFAAVVALAVPATAQAWFEHVVLPGETLTSVAAADGLTIRQLATANGLSPEAEIETGTLLAIPPRGVIESAPAPAPARQAAPAPAGAREYVVRPGDTLGAIAERLHSTVAALAAANGLDPAGVLLAGSTLRLAATTAAATAAASPEFVSPSFVGAIAAANGLAPSLAEAVADQESGFNDAMVSATGATGVMQIEPGTWNYIGDVLGATPLSPDSAADNVRAGVLLLLALLRQTGDDGPLAIAGYYQGLRSVREHGMYADTRQYVDDVLALQARFGGP
jgi:soluble lytic murein transglycosylase-like protein